MRVEDRMQHADAVIFKRYGMMLGIPLHRIQLDGPSDRLRGAGFQFNNDCFDRLI